MAKYYIASGDLEKIISTNLSPKMACKRAIEEFIDEHRYDKNKSVATSIGISQKGFRHPDSKVKRNLDDAVYFEVLDIVEL